MYVVLPSLDLQLLVTNAFSCFCSDDGHTLSVLAFRTWKDKKDLSCSKENLNYVLGNFLTLRVGNCLINRLQLKVVEILPLDMIRMILTVLILP